MPHDRKDAIRQDLVEAHQALVDALDQVGPDDWDGKANEGWTVCDLLTHLTTSESGFVPTLRRMAAGEGGVPADFDPNRWNAGQLRRRAGQTPEELRAELQSAHRDMLALLDSISEAALDNRGHLSSGQEGSTEDNFRLVADHKRSHTQDIRAAFAAVEPAATDR